MKLKKLKKKFIETDNIQETFSFDKKMKKREKDKRYLIYLNLTY